MCNLNSVWCDPAADRTHNLPDSGRTPLRWSWSHTRVINSCRSPGVSGKFYKCFQIRKKGRILNCTDNTSSIVSMFKSKTSFQLERCRQTQAGPVVDIVHVMSSSLCPQGGSMIFCELNNVGLLHLLRVTRRLPVSR